MNASFRKEELQFKIPAQTSRGAYTHRKIHILSLVENGIHAEGEIAPLPGLSIDAEDQIEHILTSLCDQLNRNVPHPEIYDSLSLHRFPAICFGLESAFQNLKECGGTLLFPSAYTKSGAGIPVNGLVWMDTAANMLKQVSEKIEDGYSCIKIKIGTLDFEEECRMLEQIRKRYSAFAIELRVDANGAFSIDDAGSKLKDLSRYELHSIEQPIKQGQWETMHKLCRESKVPIALDEELIGIHIEHAGTLLKTIHPAYIVLKPTFLGGFRSCDAWIRCAVSNDAGFWITSALESNIGLNAIAQYCGKLGVEMAQGLGTGQLFSTNFKPAFNIRKGKMYYTFT